jgi:hypothetical protein
MPAKANAINKVLGDYWKSRSLKSIEEREYARGGLYRLLEAALAEDLVSSGIDPTSIVSQASIPDADSYRLGPRRWDLAIVRDGLPAVVIELKALVSRNITNAYLDELVAAATNVKAAFDGFGAGAYRPGIALVIILDGSGFLARLGGDKTGIDSALAINRYVKDLHDSLQRMLSDGLADAICLLITSPGLPEVVTPFPEFSFDAFSSSILKRSPEDESDLSSAKVQAEELGRVLALGDVSGVMVGLTSTAAGLSAAEAAVIDSRRRLVSKLQALAMEPDATETKMHKDMVGNYWLFGGQYIGETPRRNFVPLDQHDIPLISSDGSLQIVELKGPDCTLIQKHRNHYIVSNEVHEAVGQCLNYLRALDEMGSTLRTQYRDELNVDLDFRRARGTVVIGHPDRGRPAEAIKAQVEQTIRSYNAHLTRIQVTTYADLLEAADRALRFEIDADEL